MTIKGKRFLFVLGLSTLGLVVGQACDRGDRADAERSTDQASPADRTPAPSVLAESADGKEAPAPPSLAQTAADQVPPDEDALLVCEVAERCERKCTEQCMAEQWDRSPYYKAKRDRIADSPFEIEVHRVYLTGACHEGGVPERRRSADGIAAVVEGQVTYKGEDVLYAATPEGEMTLRLGETRFVEAEVADPGAARNPVSRFDRPVHGSDPWLAGQTRAFHWESTNVDPVFCEVVPDEAEAHIDLVTAGVRNGRRIYPVGFVTLAWDEVVGMALRQEVKVRVRKGAEMIEEPADAHYAKRDKILITRLTGTTEWVSRSSIVQDGDLTRAPEAVFPVTSKSDLWTVTVNGISQVREFGGYAPKGEDQFLAALDLEFSYTPGPDGDQEPAGLKKMQLRLETSSGRWQLPITKAAGQLDPAQTVKPGGAVKGTVVFPKQRFERPFRLEVKTPDKAILYLDVFSYALGPERSFS